MAAIINVKITKQKDILYPIIIGAGIVEQLSEHISLQNYSKIFIISDTNVAPLWMDPVVQSLKLKPETIIMPAGEHNKNLPTLATIWQELLAKGADRSSLVINLGGGVVGDIGAMAASTFKRGIDFVQIPTTLLSMVDASVGGKTAIDLNNYKNIVGTFAQPKAVLIDVQFLPTLPERELISGFGEIIKHGLIADRAYFELVTSKPVIKFSAAEMVAIITKSCEIKAKIVAQDPEEKGMRKILNCGHTIGHAVESLSMASKKPLLHGEAVAIGLNLEAQIAEKLGRITKKQQEIIIQAIASQGLPVTLPSGTNPEKLFKIMKIDKKNSAGKIKWALIKGIGQCGFDIEVPDNIIKDILFIKK